MEFKDVGEVVNRITDFSDYAVAVENRLVKDDKMFKGYQKGDFRMNFFNVALEERFVWQNKKRAKAKARRFPCLSSCRVPAHAKGHMAKVRKTRQPGRADMFEQDCAQRKPRLAGKLEVSWRRRLAPLFFFFVVFFFADPNRSARSNQIGSPSVPDCFWSRAE